jgi:large repetitive protein
MITVDVERCRDNESGLEQVGTAMFKAKTFAVVLTFFACALAPVLLWGGGGGFVTAFVAVATAVSTGGTTLSGPELMAVDNLGNIYIADTGDNQVVEVTAGGVASVVSFPGLSPALSSPKAVAVDGAGDLFVADSSNARVVKLSAGVASVVNTASLLSNPVGVAVDAAGDLYISDATNNDIVEVPAGGSAAVVSISGLGTPLSQPSGLALDLAGNLYISDTGNIRIVKVTTGGVGSVYFTTGLVLPEGVAVDGLGNLYVADASNSVIEKDTPTGAFSIVSTPGFTLSGPRGVAVSVWGAVYVADTTNNRIVETQPATVGFGHLQYGTASGTTLTLNVTIGQAMTFSSVQAFTEGAPALDYTVTGTTCVAGTTSNAACTVNIQFLPTAAGLRKGTMVLHVTQETPAPPIPAATILSVPLYGFADAPLATLSPGTASAISTGDVATETPFQVTEDGAGNMYAANYEGNNVVKIPAGGGTATVVSLGEELTTNMVAGVALDGAGNLFICDHYGNRIIEVTPAGVASVLNITGLSTGLNLPTGLAVDAANNLYISDYGNDRIVKVTPSGAGSVVATPGFTPGDISVLGVAVDAAGTVYLPDSVNNRVIKVTAAGAASLVAPEGLTPALSAPQGVAVDGFGNLYIADAGNNRLVEVTSAGVALVMPTPGLTPTLGTFFALSADSSGNVLVPDFGDNRIVELNVGGASLAFPNTGVGATSSPQTAAVTNIGDLPLVFSASPAYTANFSENSGDTNLCASSTSLGAGEECDVSVEFTPQSVGSLSAGITLTNNNLNGTNATESVAVSGTGTLTTTTTALAASPNPAVVGQSVLLTATVSPAPTGSSLGTVSFYNGATLLGSGNVNSSGVATFSTSSLPMGANSLTAVYSGNTTFATSTSSVYTETINALTSTTTALAAAPNPATAGQSVTLTATVSPAPTGSPLGTVSFYNGETLLGSGNVNSSGAATFSLTTLPAGADSLTAVYSGNATFATSTSSAYAETILTGTTTTLRAAPNPANVGQSVTLTATVSPAPTGSSLGTVSFYNGETLLGSGNVNSSGAATFSLTTLPAGADSLTAVYSGNAAFAASTSSTYAEAILTSTATALAAAPNPGTAGQSVTLTATVSPAPTGSALGTVSFYNGETLLGSGNVNSSGVATFSLTTLPAGADSLTAVYSGNANFATSTSIAYAETVLTGTATALSGAPNPAIVGQSVTLTASVSPAPTGSALGTVSFYNGETLLSSGNVNSSGVATFSTSSLPTGADSLKAVYSGNPGFAGSTSSVYTETINTLTNTTTALSGAPNPATVGQSVTLTATVSPAPTGSSLGTVSFYNGETLLGSGNVNSSAAATFSTTTLPATANSLTAVYSGNASFAASTSSAFTETVTTLTSTTTALTAAPNPAVSGQTITFTATISPAPTGTPTGTVNFYDGSTLLGTETVNSAGVALLTSGSLPTGALAITAVYSGNAASAGSTSSALTETVNTTYTVTAPTAPFTVAEGGSVQIKVTVPPVGGAFDSVVTMTATGLPPGATASFNPPTVTPGSAGAPTELTIQLAPLAAGMAEPPRNSPYRQLPFAAFALTIGLCGLRSRRKRAPRMLKRALASGILACAVSTLIGCGGGFLGPSTTQPGSYVVTITGTSGSTHASAMVTVVVQ